MWDYTDKVMEHFTSPHNVGEIKDADAIGEIGSLRCGDMLKLYLKIENETITDAKFKTFGCASSIASASILTDLVIGKNIKDAMHITNKDIAESLGGLPDQKLHCSVMGQEALEAALKDYYCRRGEEMPTREEYTVCKCYGLTNFDIERCAEKYKLTTVEEIGEKCKAGTLCGTCRGEIQKILADMQGEFKQSCGGCCNPDK